jgi:oligopeptide/dipeptide ABC transporter ATP-binding protein
MGEVPSLAARPSGCEFHTRCPRAQPLCTEQAPDDRNIGQRVARCHFPLVS